MLAGLLRLRSRVARWMPERQSLKYTAGSGSQCWQGSTFGHGRSYQLAAYDSVSIRNSARATRRGAPAGHSRLGTIDATYYGSPHPGTLLLCATFCQTVRLAVLSLIPSTLPRLGDKAESASRPFIPERCCYPKAYTILRVLQGCSQEMHVRYARLRI